MAYFGMFAGFSVGPAGTWARAVRIPNPEAIVAPPTVPTCRKRRLVIIVDLLFGAPGLRRGVATPPDASRDTGQEAGNSTGTMRGK